MDRKEQSLRIEELKGAMRVKNYPHALEIARTFDIKKIKDNGSLCLIAEAYEANKNYIEAKRVLLTAYDNTMAGRQIAYKLCVISTKTKEFDEARKYYEDFVEMAPRDNARYILKYRMAKAKGEPIEELISILEEYVHLDMEEKWAYELARLYSKAGEIDKCVDMCDEISIWFSEGKYVNKAMELKEKYALLTPAQQEKYDETHRINPDIEEIKSSFAKKEEETEDIKAEVEEKEPIEIQSKEAVPEKKKKLMPFQINPDMIAKTEIEKETEEARRKEEKPDSRVTGEIEEIVLPEPEEEPKKEETIEELLTDEISDDEVSDEEKSLQEETTEETETNENNDSADVEDTEKQEESKPEKLYDINDVSDILKQLQARGILKAETVQQAVNIIDEASEVKDEESVDEKTLEKQIEMESKPAETPSKTKVEDITDEIVEDAAEGEEEKVEEIVEEPVANEEISVGDDIVEEADILDEIPEEVEIIDEDAVEIVRPVNKEPMQEETEPETKVENNVQNPEAGSTQIFDKAQIKEELDKMKETRAIPEGVVEKDNKNVPVFDLSFETPQRDESNDMGQKNIYENIAANSDLGYKTDKLPTREELQEAIKKAEQVVNNSDTDKDKEVEEVLDLKVKVKPSSKVEILAGAGVVEEGTINTEELRKKNQQEDSAEKTENNPEERVEKEEVNAPEKTIEENAPEKEEKVTVVEAQPKKEEPAEKTATEATGNDNSGEDILSEDELTEFKNYLNVEGFETSIREVIEGLITNYVPNGKSDKDNVIIMGNEKTGKTTLAIELIKLVNKKRGRRNRRLAKVDAAALNRKGFRYALNKLIGSDLIIENAHTLGKMTLSEIIDVSGMFTDDMLIVLEGETEGMEELIASSSRVQQVFNRVVRIKEYDIKEWVEYGKKYAMDKGYGIDELANLAFYKAIDDFFGANKGIGQKDVENIIDNAISKSGRLGRKVKGIFESKTDGDGLKILQESDFNI